MGPKGRAAANPATTEIKKRDGPGWYPEKTLRKNMVLHTGNGGRMHEEKQGAGRRTQCVEQP